MRSWDAQGSLLFITLLQPSPFPLFHFCPSVFSLSFSSPSSACGNTDLPGGSRAWAHTHLVGRGQPEGISSANPWPLSGHLPSVSGGTVLWQRKQEALPRGIGLALHGLTFEAPLLSGTGALWSPQTLLLSC